MCIRLIGLCLISTAAIAAPAATEAQLPLQWVDTEEPPPAARTFHVANGAQFQRALDESSPGDAIALDPRGNYRGPFTLPRKRGGGWIAIRGTEGAHLPPPGSRVDPSSAALMPRLVAAGGPALRAAAGAHHYWLEGIELRPEEGTFVYNLVELGDSTMPDAEVPHHITFARCYLHGDPAKGARRGIAMNSAHTAVVDSWLSDFKESGGDAQAIAAWSGPGPFKIANSHLEASGENVLFGGADPPAPSRIPSDIEVEGNRFAKPLSWKPGEPGYAGARWTVKNLFELKNARRVLVQGNVFEHNWVDGQSGFAILFTVRNQDGTAPWSVVEDVTFAGNVVRSAASAISVLGKDDSQPAGSAQTRRITIRNNLFDGIGGARWGGGGTLFQILNGAADLIIERNSAFQSGNIVMAEGPPNMGFVFRQNLVQHNAYGMAGTGTAPGASTLAAYFPGASVEGNVFIGGDAARYPGGNRFVSSAAQVFEGPRAHLVARAPYRGAGAEGLAALASQPEERSANNSRN
jgi:hypothetical protein